MHFPRAQCRNMSVSQHLCGYFCAIATSLCIYYTDVSRMLLFVQIAILLCCTSVPERDMDSRCTPYEVMIK